EHEAPAALEEDERYYHREPKQGAPRVRHQTGDDTEEHPGPEKVPGPGPRLLALQEDQQRNDHVEGQADLGVPLDERVRRPSTRFPPPVRIAHTPPLKP